MKLQPEPFAHFIFSTHMPAEQPKRNMNDFGVENYVIGGWSYNSGSLITGLNKQGKSHTSSCWSRKHHAQK
jgi:hypothetical protein